MTPTSGNIEEQLMMYRTMRHGGKHGLRNKNMQTWWYNQWQWGKLSCIPKKILRKPIGFSIQTYGVDDAPGDPTNLGSRRGTWVKLEGKRNRNNHDNSHHHFSTKNKWSLVLLNLLTHLELHETQVPAMYVGSIYLILRTSGASMPRQPSVWFQPHGTNYEMQRWLKLWHGLK